MTRILSNRQFKEHQWETNVRMGEAGAGEGSPQAEGRHCSLLQPPPGRSHLLRAGPGLPRDNQSVSITRTSEMCLDFQKVTALLGRQGTEESGAREGCIVNKSNRCLLSVSGMAGLHGLRGSLSGPWGGPDGPVFLEDIKALA